VYGYGRPFVVIALKVRPQRTALSASLTRVTGLRIKAGPAMRVLRAADESPPVTARTTVVINDSS